MWAGGRRVTDAQLSLDGTVPAVFIHVVVISVAIPPVLVPIRLESKELLAVAQSDGVAAPVE